MKTFLIRIIPLAAVWLALGCASTSRLRVETPVPAENDAFIEKGIGPHSKIVPMLYIIGDPGKQYTDAIQPLFDAVKAKGYSGGETEARAALHRMTSKDVPRFKDFVSSRIAARELSIEFHDRTLLIVGTSWGSNTVTWETTRTTSEEIGRLEDGSGRTLATYYRPVTRTQSHARTRVELFAHAWLFDNGQLLYERTVLDADSDSGTAGWTTVMTQLLEGIPSAGSLLEAHVSKEEIFQRRRENVRQRVAGAPIVTLEMLPPESLDSYKYHTGNPTWKTASAWVRVHEHPKPGQLWGVTKRDKGRVGCGYTSVNRWQVVGVSGHLARVEHDDGFLIMAYEVDLTKKLEGKRNVTKAWIGLRGGEPVEIQVREETPEADMELGWLEWRRKSGFETFSGINAGGRSWSGRRYDSGKRAKGLFDRTDKVMTIDRVYLVDDGWFDGEVKRECLDPLGNGIPGYSCTWELTSYSTDSKPWLRWR